MMNVFASPELRFTAALPNGQRIVSCQASNRLLVTDAKGDVVSAEEADFRMPQGIAVSKERAEINCGVSLPYVSVYVVDRYHGCVKVFRKYTPDGAPLMYERSFGEVMPNAGCARFGCVW